MSCIICLTSYLHLMHIHPQRRTAHGAMGMKMNTAVKIEPTGVYTIEGNMKPILSGLAPLPNASDVDPLNFLNNLAAGGHSMEPVWGWTILPDSSRKQWTQFFLTQGGMGGYLDGQGYAVTYGSHRYDEATKKSLATPIVRHFAICKHEQQLASGANPSRGWHPGNCKHCGMNMTVDSGD